MGALGSSETSVPTRATRHKVREGGVLGHSLCTSMVRLMNRISTVTHLWNYVTTGNHEDGGDMFSERSERTTAIPYKFPWQQRYEKGVCSLTQTLLPVVSASGLYKPVTSVQSPVWMRVTIHPPYPFDFGGGDGWSMVPGGLTGPPCSRGCGCGNLALQVG
jgi:hypothetical protein